MPRALAVLTALILLAPASASANPAIAVESSLQGRTTALPLTAGHVLTLTAGAVPERLNVSVNPVVELTVANAAVEPPTAATGPSLSTCPGRWNRLAQRSVFRFANPHEAEATFTIAAGQTATVTADVTLVRTPFDDDTLDAEWSVEPAQGGAFTIFSPAPGAYDGRLGVDLDFDVIRVAGGYLIDGTAATDVERGRVELWGYPPRSTRAVRLARVPVRSGGWLVRRWTPPRSGEWELYARYSGGGRDYADSVSACGLPTVLRR
jgi:hypothetical protein